MASMSINKASASKDVRVRGGHLGALDDPVPSSHQQRGSRQVQRDTNVGTPVPARDRAARRVDVVEITGAGQLVPAPLWHSDLEGAGIVE